MKKILFITIVVLTACNLDKQEIKTKGSKTTQSSQEKKDNVNHYKIAEKFIKELEPKKAIPHLRKVGTEDPNFQKAQELIKTFARVYDLSNEKVESNSTDNVFLSSTDSIALLRFQEKWSKEQMKLYKNYLIDYQINDNYNITFTLSEDASSNGSLSSHESLHIPTLTDKYLEEFKTTKIPIDNIKIHFKRLKGHFDKKLFTSDNGWLPAEYLWYNVVLYYGEGSEKRMIGEVINGLIIDGEKFVSIKTASGTVEKKSLNHIKNSYYFIKADDKSLQTQILKFKS